MKRTLLLFSLSLLALQACEDDQNITPAQDRETWRGAHVETLVFGAQDNSEVVKLLPNGNRAILVASRSRKVTLLEVSSEKITELRSVNLFPDDTEESELTHIDFDSQGRFAVITRTLPTTQNGELVSCSGSLVFVDVSDGESFGEVLQEIEVGPMPDAVDISPDDRWLVSADEVDFNDDKCPLPGLTPSISVLELPSQDPKEAKLRAQILLQSEAEENLREPEQVIFAADNDTVAVTLQDTHELLTFRVSEIVTDTEPQNIGPVGPGDDERISITKIPNREDGAEPWPDGVAHFVDQEGTSWFVTAGEFNDTLAIFSKDGAFHRQIEIREEDMPGDLPRNLEEWSLAPFRPDSIAPFSRDGRTYLAFSLKHAGAVGVWSVEDVDKIELVQVIKVGANEMGSADTESSLGMEGISANNQGMILTANEKESSVSLVTQRDEP